MNRISVKLSPDSTSAMPLAGTPPAQATNARAAAAGGRDDDGEEDDTRSNGPAMVQGLVEETEAAMRQLGKLHPAFSLVATGLSEAMKTRRRFTAQYEQMRCDFDATGAFMGKSSTARSPIADTAMLAEWASWCAMDCEKRLHQLTAVTGTYRSQMNPRILDLNEQEATSFLLFLGEMATEWAACVVDERFGVLSEIEDCTDVAEAQELYRAHGTGNELRDHRRICMTIACSMGSILASALATDGHCVDLGMPALTAALTPPSAVSDAGNRPTGRSMRVLNCGIELHGNGG